MFNSLAKLPNDLCAGGTSAIIEADPDLFDKMGVKWMAAALKTAFEKGVGQLQFNVVKAETLIEAQRDRSKFPNLCVRVAGFSQKFVLLSKDVQDHIIARTKHRKA